MIRGHVFKEIQRKVRTCVIKEGLHPDECVSRIEEEYELEEEDKSEIREMAKNIGK